MSTYVMSTFGTINNSFTHLWHRSSAEQAWCFPNVRRLWLEVLLISAGLVVGLIGYGALKFRALDRLELSTEEPDVALRLARVLDEELLQAVRARFDAREAAHKQLLENPSADVIDPAR